MLLLGTLALGCAHGMVPRPPDQPAPAPATLLQALQARQSALRTLELETRTTSWLSGDRVRATVLMLVDRAGRLRFEAEIPVQGAVAALTVHGNEFALLDLQRHLFHKGPACPANVSRLIPIPLLPEEIAAILLGDAPVAPDTQAVEVSWDGKRQADVLALERRTAGAGASRLWVTMKRKPTGYDVLAVEGQSPGARDRWRVSYEDLGRADGATLPGVIRFAEPGKSFDDGVEIKVKERLGLNRVLRDEQFVLAAPAGYPVETLRCY
jgi:hypothetical protein